MVADFGAVTGEFKSRQLEQILLFLILSRSLQTEKMKLEVICKYDARSHMRNLSSFPALSSTPLQDVAHYVAA